MDENRGDVILETEHLCYSYDSRKAAMQDVNLSVRKGERIAVLGSNGAGKSTCFLNLNGVLSPDSGKILYRGTEITKRTGTSCESTLELCFRRQIIRLSHQRWQQRFHLVHEFKASGRGGETARG